MNRWITVSVITWMMIITTHFSAMAQSAPSGIEEDGVWMDWRERMKLLNYTPRYFGPNAFPFSELTDGRIGKRWELELRGEYHEAAGDRTADLFARLFIPIADGRAGVEMSGVVGETYQMSRTTQLRRHAAERRPPEYCIGDFILRSFYQVVRSDRWLDLMLSANLKTASGNRLADARYTDAASYWFDATAGRDLFQLDDGRVALRLQGMLGFYCWMTNDAVYRQNDALLFGAGLSGRLYNVSFAADYSGFSGYKNTGDHPATYRYKLEYEYRKNILSLRFRYGVFDNLYDSFSVGYIRCF